MARRGPQHVCALGVATVIASWPFIIREAHRRITLGVVTVQALGLTLDVIALLASALFGKQAKPLYLLLEAGLVQLSTVLLFATWYAAIDHHRQEARRPGNHAPAPRLPAAERHPSPATRGGGPASWTI